MKKQILLFIGIFIITLNTKAQDGFEAITLSGTQDANKLMEAYFSPVFEGFMHSMNNGWYHTAKAHKKFGFDLSFGASAAIVPEKKEFFSISGLTTLNQPTGSLSGATIVGPNTISNLTVTQEVDFGGSIGIQQATVSFEMPGGLKEELEELPITAIPAPFVQLNIGLPLKFEAMFRGVPKIDLGKNKGKLDMVGIGIKKEITGLFKPSNKSPLHVSLFAAYTKMNINYGIDDIDTSELQINNGAAKFALTTFTAQAIASLNFPIINIYGGFGYNSGNTNISMSGTYAGNYSYTDDISGQTFTQKINLTPPNLNFSAAGMRSTAGVRLSLGFLKIFADYTFQEYDTISGGIAFSLR